VGLEPITTEIEFPSARLFQVWTYRVGHSQLLLRSNREEGLGTRIELLFKSVSAVNLPTAMSELAVRVLEGEDAAPQWADAEARTVYAVTFAGGEGYVIAGAALASEDSLDYADPSAFADSLGE
jgi:hypothetical protein